MTDTRARQIEEIEGLLAERRKYEQWLAQLEARKEKAPAHVFEKVHADYLARLTEAQKKLSSESGAVHALAAELEQSLVLKERKCTEHTDERAEAELRAAVGEYDEKAWEELRVKLDGTIADLTTERDRIRKELDTLRALIREAEPAAGGEPKRDVDDIAFVRSLLGRSTPFANAAAPAHAETAAEPPPAAPPATPRSPTPKATPMTPRSATPMAAPVTAPVTAPLASRSPMATPLRSSTVTPRPTQRGNNAPSRNTAPELFTVKQTPLGTSSPPRGTDDDKPHRPSGTFGKPTPRTTEAVKSLKCQECGTLNYPTEWYCERCGGELATF
jgi:hypothetical protein